MKRKYQPSLSLRLGRQINLATVVALLFLTSSCESLRLARVDPGHDPVVVHAEQVYQEAFDASDALFKLEKINRPLIMQTAPSLHTQINNLKPKVKKVLANANADIKAYKYNRNFPGNLGRINGAIAALSSILQQIRDTQNDLATSTKTNP